jgi:uncharacterized protein (TIGR00730 family)
MNPNIARAKIKNIAFFGDANIPKSDPVYKHAYDVAKILGKEGYTIVNGGGPGVMDASTHGAEDGGGETISVVFTPTDAPGYEGKYLGNVTDEEIVTTNYVDRMFKLLEHADMFIIFKGGSGTLSEWGTTWALAKLYYGHHKPFILFGRHWIEIIDTIRHSMNISKEELSVFEICEKEKDVIPVIKKFEKKLEEVDHSKHCKVCMDKAFMK